MSQSMSQRMSQSSQILVGVDGSDASLAAVRFAAREAGRVGASLHLVHVLPSRAPITPMAPMVRMDFAETGAAILAEAESAALEGIPGTSVTTSLLDGPRVPTLVKEARDARMLALGHVRGPSIDRLVTGATVTAVAARAACPVVAVPADHVAGHEHACVLVGVKSTEHSRHLLHRGFELAAERHARLLLVHAWEFGRGYDDLIAARIDTNAWEVRARDAIEQGIAPLQEQFPQVPTEIRIVHGQPARVLCDATAEADLMLMARRPRIFPRGHLGGTARALLRHGRCPVVIEPSADEPEASAEPEIEQAGSLTS